MTALQLNTEIYRSLSIISEDENMLKKVAKYLARVANQITNDPTCMSEEEYFRRLDEAESKYAQGIYFEMKPNESLEDFLKRTA